MDDSQDGGKTRLRRMQLRRIRRRKRNAETPEVQMIAAGSTATTWKLFHRLFLVYRRHFRKHRRQHQSVE